MSRKLSSATVGGSTKTSNNEGVRGLDDMPGPKGLPYFGTLFDYKTGTFSAQTYHKALLARYEEYGDIFKETISGHTIVHLLHPEYIKTMYATEGKVPHIPPLLETTQRYRKFRDMSPGLGNTNGEEWYRLRTNINQMMMRPKAVTMYLLSVNEVADDFLKRLIRLQDKETKQVDNFNNEILRWTLESSAMTCFEKRLGCFEADDNSFQQQMIDATKRIFALSLKLRFSIPWYKVTPRLSPTWKHLIKAEDFFFTNGQRFVDDAVEKIQTLTDAGQLTEGRYGFLTYLLGKQELTYKDLSIIALSLFADGLSTTSPTMVGQLYCIAKNEEAQERLYEEIQTIAPDPWQPITAEMINKASYLKACVKEGFRFFPIGTEISRIPLNDVIVGDYLIPAGTHVQLNNNLLLRLPQYFDDPDSYKPERWIRGGSGSNIHPYLLLPFGFGPRTCAGRRFAEQEMYVMIIKLLQHFRLKWPTSDVMEQRYNMLLIPDREATIQFIPRT